MPALMSNMSVQRLKRAARKGARAVLGLGGSYDRATFHVLASLRKWDADDVIIDVGANDGRTILRWRHHIGETQVLAFEPVQSTFALLKERVRHLKGVRLFQCALGSKPDRLPIYLNARSALNSFHPDAEAEASMEIVEVDTLDAVLSREGVGQVALLKIDAEGHEMEVLKGAAQSLARGQFDLVQVEAGLSELDTRMVRLCDIQTLLGGYGYHLNRITNQSLARLGKYADEPGMQGPEVLVYCDAIFTRTPVVAPAPRLPARQAIG